ncbi:LysM peptidoglycan-binding domain-containing protein [Agromyces sp. SYSU T00194]|uniref:LysM peptidoglycan-binding domain-containing protein n=1 Tax=Agromyces chitinivorans TaxID=3158560 RepID=UPI0033909F6A
MTKLDDDGSASVDPAGGHEPATQPRGAHARRRPLGRVATSAVAVIGAVAVTLGFATPAQAAPAPRKQAKPKAMPARAATPAVVRTAAAAEPAPLRYTVVEGDTVSAIAARFGMPTASVLALNGLGWSSLIFPGQVLVLDDAERPAAVTPTRVDDEIRRHTVVEGDTVSGIASRYGLDVDDVLRVNGLDRRSLIFPGQALVLPDATGTPAASAPAAAPEDDATPDRHTVERGDTASGIAARYGVSVQSLLDANELGWSSVIHPGDVLVVPGVLAAAAEGHVVVMTAEMTDNAAVIVRVGRSLGVSDRGIVIALATAAQESGLRNLGYGDRDSLGVFQQRPSQGWGTEAEVMDVERAARAFFGGRTNPNPGTTRGLLDIAGWGGMTVTEAAQAVQRSAHPDAYAKWETSARAWLAELG